MAVEVDPEEPEQGRGVCGEIRDLLRHDLPQSVESRLEGILRKLCGSEDRERRENIDER